VILFESTVTKASRSWTYPHEKGALGSAYAIYWQLESAKLPRHGNKPAMTSAPITSAATRAELPVEQASCLFCGADALTQCVAVGRDFEYDSTPRSFEMLQCQGCELMFIQPRPAAEAMSVIYPSNYYAYNEEEGEVPLVKFFRDRVERVKVRRYQELIGSSAGAIVDIGSGDGRLLEILQRFGPSQ